ncbi:hypothetical protein T11_11617 [Trichinella zimbabwensis]|uniref:Uncharacterized protein n=1 Tax=Trichinella zimbabwensis TaxID=268475 RepID=A0A0V1GWA2_9BILA|nr:hypothetical protein T11_11617 [Trichinella zimbabwensis]
MPVCNTQTKACKPLSRHYSDDEFRQRQPYECILQYEVERNRYIFVLFSRQILSLFIICFLIYSNILIPSVTLYISSFSNFVSYSSFRLLILFDVTFKATMLNTVLISELESFSKNILLFRA